MGMQGGYYYARFGGKIVTLENNKGTTDRTVVPTKQITIMWASSLWQLNASHFCARQEPRRAAHFHEPRAADLQGEDGRAGDRRSHLCRPDAGAQHQAVQRDAVGHDADRLPRGAEAPAHDMPHERPDGGGQRGSRGLNAGGELSDADRPEQVRGHGAFSGCYGARHLVLQVRYTGADATVQGILEETAGRDHDA